MAKDKKLNPKEMMFCRLYTGTYFGNIVKSYIKAYNTKVSLDITWGLLSEVEKKRYNVASVQGVRMLEKPKIKRYIDELLDALLKDEVIDREMIKVIMQKENLNAKMRAIEEYNKLKQRVIQKFEDVTPSKVDKNSKEYKDYLLWRTKKKKTKSQSQKKI